MYTVTRVLTVLVVLIILGDTVAWRIALAMRWPFDPIIVGGILALLVLAGLERYYDGCENFSKK
jgi:predicted membrane protein